MPDAARKATLRRNPKQTEFLSLAENVTDDYDGNGEEDQCSEQEDAGIVDSHESFVPDDSDEEVVPKSGDHKGKMATKS